MKVEFPRRSLVVLIGPSGAGKSTFAARNFLATEVLSSDFFRALVSDDESNMSANTAAFEALRLIAAKRLARGRLTVVDATNVRRQDRDPFIEMARAHDFVSVAIVFNVPERVCREHNRQRTGRQIPAYAIKRHHREMRESLTTLDEEGFGHIFVLSSAEGISAVSVETLG